MQGGEAEALMEHSNLSEFYGHTKGSEMRLAPTQLPGPTSTVLTLEC